MYGPCIAGGIQRQTLKITLCGQQSHFIQNVTAMPDQELCRSVRYRMLGVVLGHDWKMKINEN